MSRTSDDEEERSSLDQSDFVPYGVLDDRARCDLEQRLLEIERHTAITMEMGDVSMVDKLQKEYSN